MKARDRVVLSWPDPGQVEGAFCTSMIELVRARGSRIEGVLRVEGGLLSRQRNEIVKHFLDDMTAEWLFMIDSDETIETGRYKPREALRCYRLTRQKAAILAHIGEIGRHQRHLARAKRARRIGRKDEPQEAFIRPRKRADKINGLSGNIIEQPDISLAIGKAAGFQCAERPAPCPRQMLRQGFIARKRENHTGQRSICVRRFSHWSCPDRQADAAR